MRNTTLFPLMLLLLTLVSCSKHKTPESSDKNDWAGYLGGKDVNHFSYLDQINPSNVGRLKVAWAYNSGGADSLGRSQIQCNPLVIDGILYGTSPRLLLFALEAATGKELWRFDPSDGGGDHFGMGVNRGLAWWQEAEEKRVFYSSGPNLYSINAVTGKPDTAFGDKGKIDLHTGLDRDVTGLFINNNTPGIVFKDKIIVGSRVSESIGHVPGHIRAFNVRTGALEWTFHTIPHPGEEGFETWPLDAWRISGGANVWSGFSLDEEKGILFAPTGSPSFDFYGGDRHGDNLFGNCVLALDAVTGKRIWHFQTVKHDVWDRDLPAPPNLVTVTHNGKKVEAVAQIAKSGYVFLLDRATGKPLFPMQEIKAPASDLEGEKTAETQVLPSLPPPFARQVIEESDLATRNKQAFDYAKSIWDQAKPVVPFAPPGTRPVLLFPGFDGGGEWGGAAADPDGILYVNHSEMPWVVQMERYQAPADKRLATRGKQIFLAICATCHGSRLEGGQMFGNIPALTGLKGRSTVTAALETIQKGKGVMPAFGSLNKDETDALIAFLFESEEADTTSGPKKEIWPYPYTFKGYTRFKAPDGYPAINPPWGRLSAIDLNKGTIKWQVILGEHPELKAKGMPATGTENYGGPVATAGGLIFIAAAMDEKIRAFDKNDGKMLWEHDLPAAGYATPATYAVNGKQYVVIACGGGKLGTRSGDTYVAFGLEE